MKNPPPNSFWICSKNKRGWTLVEILVVIGIVSILLILMLSALQGVKSRADQALCSANLRQLHMAFTFYAADHRGLLPMSDYMVPNPTNTNLLTQSCWLDNLKAGGYIANVSKVKGRSRYITFCPASTVRDATGQSQDYMGNYGINRLIAGYALDSNRITPSSPLSTIASPQKKIMVCDAGYYDVYNSLVTSGGGSTYIPGMSSNKNVTWDPLKKTDAIEGRHSGKVNVLMIDGHVEIWTPNTFMETINTAWRPQ